MEEEQIEAVKEWSEPKLVKNIQVFLGFANFYRRFIRNFNRIAASLTSMLQTTDNETLSTQDTRNKKNRKVPSSITKAGRGRVGGSIENLSNSKKAKRSSGVEFLTFGAKEAFIHLRKAFTEAPILRHFDPEHHIQIETDASGYAIGEVLSQMISDQHFSGHVIHKDPISSKSEIGQWHPIAFFS